MKKQDLKAVKAAIEEEIERLKVARGFYEFPPKHLLKKLRNWRKILKLFPK